MSKYPDNNPKTALGMAKLPMDLVPPALLRHTAEAFANGAKKYGPYNWREAKISSSVYYAAALRHLTDWWDGEDLAPDSGVHHLGHAAACLALILDTMDSDLLNDNRPPRVIRNADTRGTSEGKSEGCAEGPPSVLAHAGAKWDGQAGVGLPCVPSRDDHTRDGRLTGGPIRRR